MFSTFGFDNISRAGVATCIMWSFFVMFVFNIYVWIKNDFNNIFGVSEGEGAGETVIKLLGMKEDNQFSLQNITKKLVKIAKENPPIPTANKYDNTTRLSYFSLISSHSLVLILSPRFYPNQPPVRAK